MKDALLLLSVCPIAAVVAVLFFRWRMTRKAQAVRDTCRHLKRHAEAIQIDRKTLMQLADRAPHDPKVIFMEAHLNRRINKYNDLVVRVKEEASKL